MSGARWVLLTCLMTLACVTGIGSAAAHDEPMRAMHQVTAGAQGHDSAGHCTDMNQQCHQATADNGLAFGTPAQLTADVSGPGAEPPSLSVLPGTLIARPPDIHALCVNRI
jgi:hypothetical protein